VSLGVQFSSSLPPNGHFICEDLSMAVTGPVQTVPRLTPMNAVPI
jgi:hypothetical protein